MQPKEPKPASKNIPYYRVATQKQGAEGLGIGGQHEAVKRYAKATGGKILRAYTEVESGRRNDRPELAKALADCRRSKATLVGPNPTIVSPRAN
jgi:DNA invertase Pin-like site-specific DNA recombinase